MQIVFSTENPQLVQGMPFQIRLLYLCYLFDYLSPIVFAMAAWVAAVNVILDRPLNPEPNHSLTVTLRVGFALSLIGEISGKRNSTFLFTVYYLVLPEFRWVRGLPETFSFT